MTVRSGSYEQHPGINSSKLKQLSVSPKHFRTSLDEERDEDPEHFLLGSAVEEYICYGIESFNNRYKTIKVASPTGMMKDYGKQLLNGVSPEDAYAAVGFSPRKIGLQKVIENFRVFELWLEEMRNIGDRTPITLKQFSLIESVGNEVLNNEFTSYLFSNGEYQKEMYWEEVVDSTIIPCKALADIMHEYEDKIVLTDIKTSAQGINYFDRTILKYRYDLQAAWYCRAAETLYKKPCEFQFLVIDVAYRQSPLIYKLSPQVIQGASTGFTTKYGTPYKGWEQLLKQYTWHMKTNKWDYTEEVYNNRGVIIVNDL